MNPKTSILPQKKKRTEVPHLLDIIAHELISILEDPHALTEGLVVPDTKGPRLPNYGNFSGENECQHV